DANRIISLEYRARCATQAALASLALHEYHRRHDRYPDTLASLVPDLLPHLPVDYGDGKTLRYRRTESDDYLLYSVWLNGVDDGGKASRKDPFAKENLVAFFRKLRRKNYRPCPAGARRWNRLRLLRMSRRSSPRLQNRRSSHAASAL